MRENSGLIQEWGNDALRDADFSNIVRDPQTIVRDIGQESVAVYLFLADQFARGPVTGNHLFQFVYRSFYQLDSAGLTPEFKERYFTLMEAARGKPIDVRYLAEELFQIPNAKGQKSLQFSFVTKLAHTVDPTRAIYDKKVAKYFCFHSPDSTPRDFAARFQRFVPFYEDLGRSYQSVIARGVLTDVIQSFRDAYSPIVPEAKILDFIFWSAGRLGLSVAIPSPVAVAGSSAGGGASQVELTVKG